MVSVPRHPDLQIAFGLMIVGIVVGSHSRNVRAKRIVLPIILALFSWVFIESIRRTLNPPVIVLVVLSAILMWNGIKAMRQVRFCARCGRTLQDKSKRKLCKECRESSSSSQG
jgi:Na+/H+-dicarboxylate symporter